MSLQTDNQAGSFTSKEPKPRKSIATLWRAFIVRNNEDLDARDAASTLFRFFRSNHVLDLNLIFNVALGVLIFEIILTIVAIFTKNDAIAAGGSAAITISGAILAWSYLTASKRLGVVDLFACEIVTLCRLGTIFDVGRSYVERWKRMEANNAIDAPSRLPSFVSEEDYFPIFETNSQDLQALESLIVGHITEFYTYMKACRDSLRKLAQIETVGAAKETQIETVEAAKETQIETVKAAKETLISIIYMLFLGYESGRKAIDDLVEFQPTRAENMIVILLTELECYSLLCEQFKGDKLRFRRLQLRQSDYEYLVPHLVDKVNERHGTNEKYWAPAQRLIQELQTRYGRALEIVRRCDRETAT